MIGYMVQLSHCMNTYDSSVVVNPWDESQMYNVHNWDHIRFDYGVSMWF